MIAAEMLSVQTGREEGEGNHRRWVWINVRLDFINNILLKNIQLTIYNRN